MVKFKRIITVKDTLPIIFLKILSLQTFSSHHSCYFLKQSWTFSIVNDVSSMVMVTLVLWIDLKYLPFMVNIDLGEEPEASRVTTGESGELRTCHYVSMSLSFHWMTLSISSALLWSHFVKTIIKRTCRTVSGIGKNDVISMFKIMGINSYVSFDVIIFKNVNIHCIFWSLLVHTHSLERAPYLVI